MRCASAETLVPVASSAGSRVREIDVATSIDGTRPGKRSGNDVLGGCVSSVDDSRNRPCLAELPLTCRPDVVLGLRIRVSEGGEAGEARGGVSARDCPIASYSPQAVLHEVGTGLALQMVVAGIGSFFAGLPGATAGVRVRQAPAPHADSTTSTAGEVSGGIDSK